MNEAEALTLRKNGARLYSTVRVALFAVAASVTRMYEPDNSDAIELANEVAEHVWHSSHLDDVFHTLSSQGYQALIRDGWNPYVSTDPNDWTPSPDCIDHPTTRGGVSSCDVTPDGLRNELRRVVTESKDTAWEVLK